MTVPAYRTRSRIHYLQDVTAKETSNKISQPDVEHSIFDRIEINGMLNTTFGQNISTRQIRSIIKGYLNYPHSEEADSTLSKFIEKCTSIIKANNENKDQNEKAAVILMTSHDENPEPFYNDTFLPQLEELAKSHYIALRVVGTLGETLGEAIRKVAKELGSRHIMTLIVKAHGTENSMILGDNCSYTSENASKNDFTPLHPKASIIFDSCLTANTLAEKVASIAQPRSIFAYSRVAWDRFITPCCPNHGYGVVAFDEHGNQIAVRFKKIKCFMTYSPPCCITNGIPCCKATKKITEIKEKLFDHTIQAAQSGDAFAQLCLSCAYINGHGVPQSYETGVEWTLKAANQGYAPAQFNLGSFYEQGQGVPKSNTTALEWYIKAAEQGHMHAQYNLGNFFSIGQGVPKNEVIAAKWFLKAAEQGYVNAQFNLGNSYAIGKGVPVSDKIAIEWYLKAAKQGLVNAQYALSLSYARAGNLEEALKWMKQPAKQRYLDAKEKLDLIKKEANKSTDSRFSWIKSFTSCFSKRNVKQI